VLVRADHLLWAQRTLRGRFTVMRAFGAQLHLASYAPMPYLVLGTYLLLGGQVTRACSQCCMTHARWRSAN
jgi:hypothetical protein